MLRPTAMLLALTVVVLALPALADEPEALPGTEPLTIDGDIAAQLVDGVDRFLLRKTADSVEQRKKYWKHEVASLEALNRSIAPNRERLKHILGLRDQRVPFDGLELLSTTEHPALVGQGDGYKVYAVRWPAFGDVYGEGLLLEPERKPTTANVPKPDTRPQPCIVAIPDADVTPEQLAGLVDGVPAESQYARRLAESGCRVVVPMLVSRHMERRGLNGRRGANLTNREYLYRSAFELGRHLIGYEIQKALALVDWFEKDQPDAPIGVIGWGEGGMLALYAAAVDPRIDAACVSGYFGSRQNLWQEPLDRNVFGLLEQFGDAELAGMIAPRPLVIEAVRGPELVLPSEGGGPGRLVTPPLEEVRAEVIRSQGYANGVTSVPTIELIEIDKGNGAYGHQRSLSALLMGFDRKLVLAKSGARPKSLLESFDPSVREKRQMHEIDRHNQWLLAESEDVRKEFMKGLDTSSLEKYSETVETYRDIFRHDVIGHFDDKPQPFNPRSRKAYDEEKWTGYEVVLDVFPDVIAYGILCLPKDLKPGDKRPVVVCQHGLEGRPQDVVTGDHRAYHDFASKLAEQGFITFAPQNLYIGEDRFRTLQRKANPLKKTLFSVIVPQHQQIVDWLQTLPNVDPDRIAFYGLSYGGKSAMRIPPLVTDYCLSICSADFNEWVGKNASTRLPYSYVWTKEYEIFEFDLGSTFNYAEMAALIAPRPFMVERGHFDGVGSDWAVAYEFAKVRNLYQAQLGIGDRCEIEFFVGPHTINGKGTFAFLHKHLNWPRQPSE